MNYRLLFVLLLLLGVGLGTVKDALADYPGDCIIIIRNQTPSFVGLWDDDSMMCTYPPELNEETGEWGSIPYTYKKFQHQPIYEPKYYGYAFLNLYYYENCSWHLQSSYDLYKHVTGPIACRYFASEVTDFSNIYPTELPPEGCGFPNNCKTDKPVNEGPPDCEQ